jgi:ferredoxin
LNIIGGRVNTIAVNYKHLIRETGMKVRIEDTCTACGLCCDTCPEVFEMGPETAQVKVDEVPAEREDAVQQAADECPVEAIAVE